MFKINVPHPIGNRTFATREDAARIGRHFGVDVRKIVPTQEESTDE